MHKGSYIHKVSIILIILFVFINGVSGCMSIQTAVLPSFMHSPYLKVSANKSTSATSTGKPSEKPSEKASLTLSPIPSPAISPSSGVDYDESVLEKLSTKSYGFGVALNTNGIPTYPGKVAMDLFNKYSGIYCGDTTKKVVYLTFDLGYENGYTPKILDTLKNNDVKAMFFVTGPFVADNKALVKRIINEGHQIGNHTQTHPDLTLSSIAKIKLEVKGFGDKFFNEFGVKFKYLRPPMGTYSERSLGEAQMLGYKSVFWSFAYKDYDLEDQKGTDYAYTMVTTHLHNGCVLLLHGVSKDNANALDSIIKEIRRQGYEIKAFDL